MSYWWKVIDLEGNGKLTPDIIKYFYTDIHRSLVNTGYDAPAVSNIIIEIYDILGVQTEYATFRDIINSDQGYMVVSMLLDINGFWQYDNRESLMQHNPIEGEGDEPNDNQGFKYDDGDSDSDDDNGSEDLSIRV